jgi:hypothetical protein
LHEQPDQQLDPSNFDECLAAIDIVVDEGSFRFHKVDYRSITLDLQVAGIGPGSQDAIPSADLLSSFAAAGANQTPQETALLTRPNPLVIPIVEDSSVKSPCTLQIQEVIQKGKSQFISIALRQTGTPSGFSALVLDGSPFSVALVSAKAIAADDLSETTALATWTNQDAAWKLRNADVGFDLLFPPQGIGEAMHRRVEDRDVTPGNLVDFRFSPPATAFIRTSDLQRRFTEVPWNLRRLLGVPGYISGALAERALFELFYGLSGAFAVPSLRLSELFARRGRFPEPLAIQLAWVGTKSQIDTYGSLQAHFTSLLRVAAARLAVFELWSQTQLAAEPGPQPPLSIDQSDSLVFHQRRTARLRYPIPGQKPPAPTDGKPDEFQDANGNLYADGLAGGWSWGFESQNILSAVRTKRDSVSATLTGCYLSALGGWGSQKASFDRGLSTIHASVEMGRTSTINIERIGRIGVLWHKAKHVIVYERTVCASRQFYLEQYPLTGNPVLRKVEEYIELIEEERQFPDKPVSALSRGFILGARFAGGKPARIHVNSKWGQDVGTTGWKIPLWVRGAVPSDVYPKPIIHMLTAGATESSQVPIAISDPEKLFFYTTTDQSLGADPDTWPVVEGVDYQIMPASSLQAPPLPSSLKNASDMPGTPPDFIPAGGSAFTLCLEPAAAAANLVAGRTPEAVSAIPRSITLMRGYRLTSADVPTDADSATAYQVARLHDHLSAVVAPLLHSANDAVKAVQDTRDALDALKAAADNIKVGPDAICDALANRVDAQAQVFEKDIRLGIVSALYQVQGGLDATLDAAFQQTGNNIALLKQVLRSNLAALIDGEDGLHSVILRSQGSIQELRANLDSVPAVLDSLVADLTFQLQYAEAALTDLADDQTFSALAAPIVDELQRQCQTLLLGSSSVFPVQEAFRAILGPQVDAISGAIASNSAGILDSLAKLSTAVKQDLIASLVDLLGGGTVAPITRSIVDFLDPVEAALDSLLADIDAALGDNSRALDRPLTALRSMVEGLIDGVATNDLAGFRKKLRDETNAFMLGADGQVDAALLESRKYVKDIVKSLCKSLVPDPAALLQRLKDALAHTDLTFLDGIKDLTPDLRARVEDLLNRWKPALDGLQNRIRLTVPTIAWPSLQDPFADGTFRLFRAFGDVPKLPNLDFNLPQIAYHFRFDDFNVPALDLSPVLTIANQLGEKALGAFNLQLPSFKLLDRFVPPKLPDFQFSQLFPSLAGLKLENLFRSLPTPPNAPDGIKVTHGSDASSRSAWMRTDVDFSSTEPANIFDLAGISLTLKSGRITATSRVDATLGESPRQRSSGAIQGDWFIKVGSYGVVNIKSSTLRFDEEGRIHFEVSPAQVQMQPPLDFLARLLEPFQSSKDGFKVAVTAEGVRTSLVLPIPNIQGGSFGIANLTLGFLFEVLILPEFTIRTALQLGKPERPFTITIFILGGAGSVQLAVSYVPKTGVFSTYLDVALYASASLAISLGPISGGIYAYAGIAVTYSASSNGASNLYFALRLLFVGEVTLLGFIDVGLSLSLEAEYRGNNNLIGRGSVNFHIKIGWFLTIEVNASVQYEFGSGQSSSSSSQQISGAAADYANMY